LNFHNLEFLKNEKINAYRLFDACRRVKDEDETSLYSLDYILACTEYEDFYNLMIQYKVSFSEYIKFIIFPIGHV
jgi:hypothetical protein